MRKRYIFGAILAALAGAISQLPLSWIAPKKIANLTPQYIGTLWKGQILGTDFGALNYSTSFLRLLTGKNPLEVDTEIAGMKIHAGAGPSGLQALNILGDLSKLELNDARLKNLKGQYKADIPKLKLMTECKHAEGEIWTNALAQNSDTLFWKGPVLQGPVTCEDGNVIAKLSGQQPGADIKADLVLDMSGTYKADILANIDNPTIGSALKYFGFRKTAQGYKLTERGRWQ